MNENFSEEGIYEYDWVENIPSKPSEIKELFIAFPEEILEIIQKNDYSGLSVSSGTPLATLLRGVRGAAQQTGEGDNAFEAAQEVFRHIIPQIANTTNPMNLIALTKNNPNSAGLDEETREFIKSVVSETKRPTKDLMSPAENSFLDYATRGIGKLL
ncbi:MAG: hypothetical protein LBH98_07320 [Chitinispirillales bacterium]|jgi:hypothetical protein|nr:hypothetical protein [Chitinispirillales bacterium]